MPRYGEASVVGRADTTVVGRADTTVVGKAWSDDHPIASAVVPAAAVGAGALKLKSGIYPNPKGAVAGAEQRITDAAGQVEAKLRAQRAAQMKAKNVPLRSVGQKWKATSATRQAGAQLKSAETSLVNAEANLAHTKKIVPKAMRPGVRKLRAGVGAGLVTAGGYGLYRRFVAPRPQQGGGYAQMG